MAVDVPASHLVLLDFILWDGDLEVVVHSATFLPLSPTLGPIVLRDGFFAGRRRQLCPVDT